MTSDDVNTTITDVASMNRNITKQGILLVASDAIKTINEHPPPH